MTQILHATTLAHAGRGMIILGPSGAGKSALALALMGMGAQLVADDQTVLTRRDGALWADAPSALRGLIEARGLGLLRADPAGPVALHLAVDLSQAETARLPEPRVWHHDGVEIPLVYRVDADHFGPGLLQYLKAGRGA